MSSYTALRGAAGFVAGIGASKIIKEIIVHNTHAPETTLSKVLVAAGTFGLGGVVSELVSSAVAKNLDEVRDSVVKVADGIKSGRYSEGLGTVSEGLDAMSDAIKSKTDNLETD